MPELLRPAVRTSRLLPEVVRALKALREQLQRELIKYGELTAQSARHEAGARRLALQLDESDSRERRLLRDIGEARAHIAELEATVEQLKATPSPRVARPKRAWAGRAKASLPRLVAREKRATRRPPKRKAKSKPKVKARTAKARAGRNVRATRR